MKSPNLQPALSPIQREILVGGMLGDLSISLDKPSLRPNPSAADYGVACLAEGSALARGPVLGPRGTVGLLRPGEAIQHTRLLDLTPVVCLVQLLS